MEIVLGILLLFGAFTLGSVTGAGILESARGDNRIEVPLTLGNHTTIRHTTAGGSLTVAGSLANSGYGVQVAGAGNTTMTGAVSGAGGLTKYRSPCSKSFRKPTESFRPPKWKWSKRRSTTKTSSCVTAHDQSWQHTTPTTTRSLASPRQPALAFVRGMPNNPSPSSHSPTIEFN